MTEFYLLPYNVLLWVTFLFVLSILSQTIVVVLNFIKRPRGLKWIFENLLELAILAHIFVCSLLHGQIIHTYTSFIPPTRYVEACLVTFSTVVLLAICVMALSGRVYPLPVIIAAAVTLPFTGALAGKTYPYLFILAIIYILARSIRANRLLFKEVRSTPSALSVKSAIDSLHTGIMFCEPGGFILLANTQMLRLMTAMTGKICRNGIRFREQMMKGELPGDCRLTRFEGHDVCLLPDGSAWMFTSTELCIGKKKYTQVTATNISGQWKLTGDLQSQNQQLMQRREELTKAIDNLYLLSHQRETQKARIRAHDILGERLTLMLRMIRGEQTPDYGALRSLSQGLLDEITADQSIASPMGAFELLKQDFTIIGVNILLDGVLPEDEEKGLLFVDIIREAVTNAVRHGLATQIRIHITKSADRYNMLITDNGYSISDIITEGEGIGGMREKIKPFGGALTISAKSRFVLAVELPGGENDA